MSTETVSHDLNVASQPPVILSSTNSSTNQTPGMQRVRRSGESSLRCYLMAIMLLNVGLLSDGRLDRENVAMHRAVGNRIEREEYPD